MDSEVAKAGESGKTDKDRNRSRQRKLSQLIPAEKATRTFQDPAEKFSTKK